MFLKRNSMILAMTSSILLLDSMKRLMLCRYQLFIVFLFYRVL